MKIREQFIEMWNREMPSHRHVSYNEETKHFVNINNSIINLQAEAAWVWFRHGIESQPVPVAPKLPTIKLGHSGEWDNPGMGLPKEWVNYTGGFILARVQYQLTKNKIPWITVSDWE